MILLSHQARFLTFLFALVQLTLPGALGVIDAMSAGDGRGSAAHVEETSRQQCRAPHTDECIICRHLSAGATRSTSAHGLLRPIAVMRPATSAEAGPRSVSHRGLHSRAPPESLI